MRVEVRAVAISVDALLLAFQATIRRGPRQPPRRRDQGAIEGGQGARDAAAPAAVRALANYRSPAPATP